MYRVLIVDDIRIIRERITTQVDRSECPVIIAGTAGNGIQALEWLQEYYADICITDIKMPVMDGLELIKKCRERFPWMTSLVISSFDEFSYAQKSIQLEAVDYILKPIEQEKLVEGIKKAVEKLDRLREAQAASILLEGMPECGKLMEKWVEHLKYSSDKSAQIINESVEMFSRLSEGRGYLLEFMGLAWLNTVACEFKLGRFIPAFEREGKKPHTPKAVTQNEAGDFFRHACTERLKDGMEAISISVAENMGLRNSKLVENIIKYLNLHFTNKDLTLQEIADHVDVSKNHITNLFKQETGMTIWHYVVDRRMKKARELLLETNLKSYEIALRVGYEDHIHFSQLFKKFYGLSPADYRKKMDKK